MTAHRERTKFGKNKRRKHHQFEAKIFYNDGEVFARRYTDRKRPTDLRSDSERVRS
jgi:hypothetical protein